MNPEKPGLESFFGFGKKLAPSESENICSGKEEKEEPTKKPEKEIEGLEMINPGGKTVEEIQAELKKRGLRMATCQNPGRVFYSK